MAISLPGDIFEHDDWVSSVSTWGGAWWVFMIVLVLHAILAFSASLCFGTLAPRRYAVTLMLMIDNKLHFELFAGDTGSFVTGSYDSIARVWKVPPT